MPYETELKFTKEEAVALGRAHLWKSRTGLWIYMIIVCVGLLGTGIYSLRWESLSTPILCFIGAFILPVMCIVLTEINTRRQYNSSKLIQNALYRYKFYEDHFEADIPSGHTTVKYSELFRVVETKERFYLYISRNQMFPILKANCSDELINFLNSKVK